MAFPTPVNGQSTDAVTPSNVKVVGTAPALSDTVDTSKAALIELRAAVASLTAKMKAAKL
jgi:hypothetical protein